MYVQWQSRKFNKNTRWRKRGDVHWRAILIENVRVDGKSTQRHIAYLGGITERNIDTKSPRIASTFGTVWSRNLPFSISRQKNATPLCR
jgi:hypothetical protein